MFATKHTAPSVKIDEERPNCCNMSRCELLSDCFSIDVPTDDPIIDTALAGTCHIVVRSEPTPAKPCRLGRREQINLHTSFIDCSHVYGKEPERARALRQFTAGRLRVSDAPVAKRLAHALLPARDGIGGRCRASQGRHCFLAGDVRNNQQAMLTALHTVMVREHNRLAAALHAAVPDATDEELYQEARKIVGAQMQKISYHEYLPYVVGPKLYRGEPAVC